MRPNFATLVFSHFLAMDHLDLTTRLQSGGGGGGGRGGGLSRSQVETTSTSEGGGSVSVVCLHDVARQERRTCRTFCWILGSTQFCCCGSTVTHTLILFQVFSQAAASLKLGGFFRMAVSHRRPSALYQPDTLSKSHAGSLLSLLLKIFKSSLFNLLTARKI